MGAGIPFNTNPGVGGLAELTSSEISLVQNISGLGDPNVDRILFWDDSAGLYQFLTIGSGLTIVGTTISSTGGGDVTKVGTPVNNQIGIWTGDGTATVATGSYILLERVGSTSVVSVGQWS